ncbi:MAG: hypothetical protein KDA32_07900 [Phycisphaerales bacterium]|nr:hypothetical protein [Phycisphaerales bacterium]
MTTLADATVGNVQRGAGPVRAPVQVDGLIWQTRADFSAALRAAGAWRQDPSAAGFQLVKRGQGREVWRGALGGISVFVKILRVTGWVGLGQRLLGRTAGAAEWRGLLRLESAGVLTPTPLAFAAGKERDGRPVEILVTEAVERAHELDSFWRGIRSDQDEARRRRQSTDLTASVADLIARSHQAGIAHPDLHPQNILVRVDSPGRYTPLLVDVRLGHSGRMVEAEDIVRNLTQLNQWFQRYASITDRWRFLKAYVRSHQQHEHAFDTAAPLALSIDALWEETRRRGPAYGERLARKRDARLRGGNAYFADLRIAGGVGQACLQLKRPISGSVLEMGRLSRSAWEEAIVAAAVEPAGAELRNVSASLGSGRTVSLAMYVPTDKPSGWAREAFAYAHKLAHRHAPVAPPMAWARRGDVEFLVFEAPIGWRLRPIEPQSVGDLAVFSRVFDPRGAQGRARRLISRLTRDTETLWIVG